VAEDRDIWAECFTADVDATDAEGRTALHIAAAAGAKGKDRNAAYVSLILQRYELDGADPIIDSSHSADVACCAAPMMRSPSTRRSRLLSLVG